MKCFDHASKQKPVCWTHHKDRCILSIEDSIKLLLLNTIDEKEKLGEVFKKIQSLDSQNDLINLVAGMELGKKNSEKLITQIVLAASNYINTANIRIHRIQSSENTAQGIKPETI